MPRSSPLINNFTAGEMSPLMEARSDFNKYPHGCRQMDNWIPLVHGGVTKRPGSVFIASTRHPSVKSRLIPFEFSTTQAYMLEFGEQYFRIFFNDGPAVTVSPTGLTSITQAATGSVTSATHGMLPGDRVFISGITAGMVQLNNREFAISATSANVYDLSELNPPKVITGITNANPAVVTSVAHGYSNGDEIVITGVQGMATIDSNDAAVAQSYIVANQTADTFELTGIDSTAFGAYTSGGVAEKIMNLDTTGYTAHDGTGTGNEIIQVRTPYAAADVEDLQFAQNADTIYFAHQDYPPAKVTRTSNTAWTYTAIDFTFPPFLPLDVRGKEFTSPRVSMNPSAPTGAMTVTASTSTFVAADVGRIFRIFTEPAIFYDVWEASVAFTVNEFIAFDGNIYQASGTSPFGNTPPVHVIFGESHSDGSATLLYISSGNGYGTITAQAGTSASVTVAARSQFPAVAAYFDWSFGAWDEVSGYPRTVTFHEDRLWWAGSRAEPQTFWGSRTGEYENHRTSGDGDSASAVSFTLNDAQVNVIEWIRSKKFLVMGTAGEEWTVLSSDGIEQAITPASVKAEAQTTEGSRPGVQSIAINDAVLFTQRDGRKLNELVFEFDQDQFVAVDRTRLSEHITLGKIQDMAYQQEPWRLVWMVLEDGSLICMTYERREDVIAWHKHPIAGTGVDVESIGAIPRSDGQGDQLWMIVERTIDGGTVRYVEALSREWRSTDEIEDSKHQDSMLTYDGSSTLTISGLWHLNGESVSILADGFVQANQTVTNGAITIDPAATKVQIGLLYEPVLETLKMEQATQQGTAFGKLSRVVDLVLRLYECGAGLKFGPSLTELDEFIVRMTTTPTAVPVPLFTGDTKRLGFKNGGDDTGERIVLKHTTPLPCTVLAAMPRLQVEER